MGKESYGWQITVGVDNELLIRGRNPTVTFLCKFLFVFFLIMNIYEMTKPYIII